MNLDPERWRTVRALFDELVELEPADRQDRLARFAETDPALCQAVEILLQADSSAADRLAGYEFPVAGLVHQKVEPSLHDSTDPLGIVGQTVAHFRVLDYLASGGMGVVYRADDVQLQRSVALKFPLPHQQLDAGMKERFLREAQAAAALDHPNLCTVYEVGESRYGVFLAMPLYPGETLKQRLARDGALPLAAALEIAHQLVAGLASAHAGGIIHRDLKPGNVMLLPDGGLKILDFGLAKVRDLSLTRSQTTRGTVSYMAPEQIRGELTDERADLWSVGVMLYEMLTGRRPFAGEHDVSVAHAILHQEPVSPAAFHPGLLRPVEDLVLSLLEKRTSDRLPSARELLSDLEALERGAAPALRGRSPTRARQLRRFRRDALRLALPLALVPLFVVGLPKLTAALRRPTKNPQAYQFYLQGREYELSGPNQAAESLYTRALALDSGFALARARRAVVYAACQAGGSRDCYRRSLEDARLDRTEQIRLEAETALRQEPRLADAHFAMGLYWEQREHFDRALAEYDLARKGLERKGELYAAIGRAHRAQGQWDEAIRAFQHALELDPRDVTTEADLATTFSRLRRYDESIRHWNRYLSLVPDAYNGLLIKGHVYLRWQGTIDTLEAILRQLPPDWRKRAVATQVLLARIQERPAEALAALDHAPRDLPPDPLAYQSQALLRAQVYADLGDSVRARAYFDTLRVTLESRPPSRPDDFKRQVALGLAYAALGRVEQAKRAADSAMVLMPPSRTMPLGTTAMKGAAEVLAQVPVYHGAAIALLDSLMQMPAGREASVSLLRLDPAWRPLRGDPRFQALLVRYAPK